MVRRPRRPTPRRLKKQLSIYTLAQVLPSELTDAPRSFNQSLLKFVALPLFIYLHTLDLSFFGHLLTIAAMIFVLHVQVTRLSATL